MLWYFPSWNGDLRISVHPDNRAHTLLTILEPTAAELEHLKDSAQVFQAKEWTDRPDLWDPDGDPRKQEVRVAAPILEVGLHMVDKLKPGVATLTAVTTVDGRVEAMGSAEPDFLKWIGKTIQAGSDDAPSEVMFRDQVGFERTQAESAETRQKEKPDSPESAGWSWTEEGQKERKEAAEREETERKRKAEEEKEKKKEKKKKETKVATVKRPTPCCPSSIAGEIGPATEVLLSFLTPEQRAQWESERRIITCGGITGHRYLIAHRHTPTARKITRICYDLDSGCVIHFHDWTVPPEEEVLAAKLILEHREPWLRNEATCFGDPNRFKNPFGGGMDGVPDASFTSVFGRLARAAEQLGRYLIR